MPNLREKLEDQESKLLLPYAIKSKYSKGRKYAEKEHPFRTVYQRDRDRIIHSTAFRRLEYKTQVFVNHEGDYYRTRLTHTLEVSQIARSIAKALNLNENLVEAIALAHDLGHTPFGHSGEEALNNIMKDFGGFNHNSQGLRVVDLLEEKYPNFKGLNLTWEVREGILKHSTKFDEGVYKWVSESRNRYFSSQEKVRGLEDFDIDDLSPDLGPSLETQVVDVADEIAYDNHDLDDGLTSGLIKKEDLENVPIWRKARKAIEERYKDLTPKMKKYQIIRYLINLQVTDLIRNSRKLLSSKHIESVGDIRDSTEKLVRFSKDLEKQRKPLRDFLMNNMYRHHRVIKMSHKAKRFVKDLFDVYLTQPLQLPPSVKDRLENSSTRKVICDYIAGMTDRYVLDEYKKLFEPYEKV